MEGALSGFAQIQQMDMSVASALNSLGRPVATIVAMIAAVGLSAGKIFFKWVKRISLANLTLNKEIISVFDDPIVVNEMARTKALFGVCRSNRKKGDCRFSREEKKCRIRSRLDDGRGTGDRIC